jgi:2-polyprenyl-6-methoxyphenol hydroxylase-like FAD-dependent oxidoreductase/ferredoxin-NADP reductase
MQTDVIIVGAGPAGATLAYLLSKSGVKVTLIESEKKLDRDFRGPAYQPACIRMWDEMDVLPHIERLSHNKISDFSLFKEGKRKMRINIGKLPAPYNKVYLMQQGPLLRLMIKLASQYENFNYIGNASVFELYNKGGVKFSLGGQEHFITGRLIVAADGRFSKLRSLASIALEDEKQKIDIVWFDLPNIDQKILDAGMHMVEGGVIIMLPKEDNQIQVGWIIPKGSFDSLKARGIAHIRNQTILAEPRLKEVVESHLTGFDQCHLLDIKIAKASKWTQDGLLLIGDAAHIASPVGAQGNKLAIEDACVAQAVILKALAKEPGLILEKEVKPFYNQRIKSVKTTLKMQKRMAYLLLEIQSHFGQALRNFFLPILPLTPMGQRARKILALGLEEVSPIKSILVPSFFPCYITRVEKQTDSAITVYFNPPKNFAYRSGQFITLRFLIDGAVYKRAYSLTSAPQIDEELSFTVKRAKGGIVSNAICDSIKPGDLIIVAKPTGNFTLPKGAKPRHYCMIGAGSGINPCYSLIKTILKYCPDATISLLDINKDANSILFKKELESLETSSKKRLMIDHHLTSIKGRPNKETIEEFTRDSRENQHDPIYYICGPDPIKEMAQNVLEAHHIKSDFILIEHFASLSEPYEELFKKAGDANQIELGVSTNNMSPQTFDVSLQGKEYKVETLEGKSLLDSCLEAGIKAPYSCKEGVCRSCRAKLTRGRVRLKNAQSLSPLELKEGYILTCQANALCDDISIRY